VKAEEPIYLSQEAFKRSEEPVGLADEERLLGVHPWAVLAVS
jgi:hypothetical protein